MANRIDSINLTSSNISGLKNAATKDVGTSSGTVAAGDDARLTTIEGKSGGVINGTISLEGSTINIRSTEQSGGWPGFLTFMAGNGNNVAFARLYHERSGDITISTNVNAAIRYFQFDAGGNFTAPGTLTCYAVTQTSDADKKKDIKTIDNALEKVLSLNGVTFNWKDSGLPSAGVIAQKLIDVLPEAVGSVFDDHDQYEEVEETEEYDEVDEGGNVTKGYRSVKVNRLVKERDETKRSYTVEYSGVVALCLQAIKELNAKVETLEKKLNPQGTKEQPDVQQ